MKIYNSNVQAPVGERTLPPGVQTCYSSEKLLLFKRVKCLMSEKSDKLLLTETH